ncbi:MAG: class I SAM-dependent methyltransferase [Bacteroidetes bacterium]|nr:class I SAM-dependent methyltransferase [Bacteroidota bacterium]
MDYKDINKDLWDKWAKLHIETAMYDMEAFRKGKSSLIGPELELLGDVSGKRILHLQCHFGQDSLSLARLGASVVGVDLSSEAVNIANGLAEELKLDAKFYCADVMDMVGLINEEFDLVFTSYGTLIWLPDLEKWAHTVVSHMKKGGKFLIVEFHPFTNVFNDEFTGLQYTYFREKPVVEEEEGSYADPSAKHVKGQSMTFDFSISEVVEPLLKEGLSLQSFKEYKYSPYDIYPNTIKTDKGYQVKGLEGSISYVFSLEMIKPEYYSDLQK